MERIKVFLDKLNNRKAQYVSFADATLGGRASAYIWYRLRYFSLKSLLTIFIHCLEFYLLFVIFNYSIATSILLFRILGFMANSFWWGALENLREEIRKLNEYKSHHQIAIKSKQWIKSSYKFIVLVSIIFIATFIAKATELPTGNHALFYSYVMAIFIEINTRIIVLTMHSTCFAIKRVYRPFYSIILPPIAGLAVLGILWNLIGGYSLVLAGLTQAGLALYWTWFYTKNMLHHTNIPLEHISNQEVQTPQSLPRHALLTALSSLFLEGSGIIVLILLHDFTSFYLLAPLIATCFNWSKLFYFDNIKYRNFWLRNLLNKFNRYAHYTSLIIAISLTILTYIILATITTLHEPILLVGLFFFFLSRALLSIRQIILFTRQRYIELIIWNIILCAYIIALSFYALHLYQLLALIALGQFIIFTILSISYKPSLYYDKHSLYLPYYPWLDLLDNNQNVYQIKFTQQCTQRDMDDIAVLFKERLGPTARCTFKEKKILYFSSSITPHHDIRKWLSTHSSGLVVDYQELVSIPIETRHANQTLFNSLITTTATNYNTIDLTKTKIDPNLKHINFNELLRKMNQAMLYPASTINFQGVTVYVLYQHHLITKILLIDK